jgi:predicted  nucleic acid-binding Zn-ribbon protein
MPATDIARKSLNTAEELRQIAAKELDDLDARKQSMIISEAEKTGDVDKARSDLQAWWKQRFDADVALSTLKAAILVAEQIISAVENKQQKGDAMTPAMNAASLALQAVLKMMADLGVKINA